MATFLDLPAPAANASGAPVDVSAMGAVKTIVVKGNGTAYDPFVLIEFSNDDANLIWTPLVQFMVPGVKQISVVARFLRATVKNYSQGGAPTVSVGGAEATVEFGELIAPAGNGEGAAVDTSALPGYKTIQVSGTFKGVCNVQVSTDAGVAYATVASFSSLSPGGAQWSGEVYANRMRISRNGILDREPSPGLPVIDIAAVDLGGGMTGLVVEDGGASEGTFTTIDFTGDGVTATDAGGGKVTVDIPGGVDVDDEGVAVASAATLDFTGAGVTATDAGGGKVTVDIPGGGSYPDITNDPGVVVEIGVYTVINDGGLQVHAPAGSQFYQVAQFSDGTAVALTLQKLEAAKHSYFEMIAQSLQFALALEAASLTANLEEGTLNNVAILRPVGVAIPGIGGLTINGFAPGEALPFAHGLLVHCLNSGEGSLTLTHNNVGSAPDNRLVLPGAASLIIPPFGGWTMALMGKPVAMADGARRWYIVGVNK